MKSTTKYYIQKSLRTLIFALSMFCFVEMTGQVRTPSEIDVSQITKKNKSETTYYFDKFLAGEIKFRDSKSTSKAQINLDILERTVDVKKGKDIYSVGAKEMVFATIDKVGDLEKVVIIIEDNAFKIFYYRGKKYSIVSVPSAKFYKKSYNAPGETNKTKITLKDSFRIIEGEKDYKISLNNKGVIKALGGPAKKVIDDNKIKIKSLNDLVRVVKALDDDIN